LHLRAAIDNMSQGFLMFDAAKRLVICNRQYIAIYGLSPDIIKPGCTLRELMSHRKEMGTLRREVDEVCAAIDAELALKKTIRRVVETTDGRSFHVVTHPMAGGGWVVTHEEITERRQAEKERDTNREFLDLILENVPAPIFVKEAGNRQYVLVNRAGETF